MTAFERALSIFFMLGMLLPCVVRAQDADKKKLMDIEEAFAKNATNGPEAGAVLQLTGTGRIGALPKATVVDLFSKPDPSDPNVKTTATLSSMHVDLYGDTSVVTYKMANTDTGHKDAALNGTEHYGCMDTFVKRNGNWYNVSNACSHEGPISAARWDAIKKARGAEPKEIQQNFH